MVRRIVDSMFAESSLYGYSPWDPQGSSPPRRLRSRSRPRSRVTHRMPPRRERPADVIALSPFRAEIGRGRRLRRADLLMAERDLEAAVRALPGDELYYVLHELGLRDAEPSPSCSWRRPSSCRSSWISRCGSATRSRPSPWANGWPRWPRRRYERVGDWLAGLDTELVALIIRRAADIYDLSHGDAPEEPQGNFFPTPDGLFVLDVRGLPEDPRRPRSDPEGGPDSAAVIVAAHRFAVPRRQQPGAAAARGRGVRARRGARGDGAALAPGAHGRSRLRRLLRGAGGLPRARPRERARRRRHLGRARRGPSPRRREQRRACASRPRWRSGSATPAARRSRARRRRWRPATRSTTCTSRWWRSPTACSRPTGSPPATTMRSPPCSNVWRRRWTSPSNAWPPATTRAPRRRCAPSRSPSCSGWASA